MQFSKLFPITCLLVATVTYASDPVQEIAEGSAAQKAYIEQLKKSNSLKDFENIEQTNQFKIQEKNAKQVSDMTLDKLAVSLETYAGVNESQAKSFTSPAQEVRKETMTGIFVSFSMTDYELQEAFKAAEENGGELYFNGIHPSDDSIGKTMVRLRKLMENHQTTATARFHPKAFQEFEITSVPAIIHARKGVIGIAHGTMNFDYLRTKMKDASGLNDFGTVGSTRPILERNLLEEIQERLTKIDGEKLKQKAVDNFWQKRQFVVIPPTKKSETFYINPTVQVTDDIVNPRGEVLAKKGQIINPLETMPMSNTYILFDATDPLQLEWTTKQIGKSVGTGILMLMTSQLHKDSGWDHLSELRKSFQREIYLIPKEMVERFAITGLPAIVTTDNQKKLVKVELISIKEQNP